MHKRIAAMQHQRFKSASRAPIFASYPKRQELKTKDETRNTMNLIRNYRNWRRYRETVSELNRLTTRELNDLGISRSDIPYVARKSL